MPNSGSRSASGRSSRSPQRIENGQDANPIILEHSYAVGRFARSVTDLETLVKEYMTAMPNRNRRSSRNRRNRRTRRNGIRQRIQSELDRASTYSSEAANLYRQITDLHREEDPNARSDRETWLKYRLRLADIRKH